MWACLERAIAVPSQGLPVSRTECNQDAKCGWTNMKASDSVDSPLLLGTLDIVHVDPKFIKIVPHVTFIFHATSALHRASDRRL